MKIDRRMVTILGDGPDGTIEAQPVWKFDGARVLCIQPDQLHIVGVGLAYVSGEIFR